MCVHILRTITQGGLYLGNTWKLHSHELFSLFCYLFLFPVPNDHLCIIVSLFLSSPQLGPWVFSFSRLCSAPSPETGPLSNTSVCVPSFLSSMGKFSFSFFLIVLKTFVRRFPVALPGTSSNFQADAHRHHLAWQESSADSPTKNRSQHRPICLLLLLSHVKSNHAA